MHNWRAYLDELDTEGTRVREAYGMVLIPGLELTDDHPDVLRSAHALAVGLRRFVAVKLGLRTA